MRVLEVVDETVRVQLCFRMGKRNESSGEYTSISMRDLLKHGRVKHRIPAPTVWERLASVKDPI